MLTAEKARQLSSEHEYDDIEDNLKNCQALIESSCMAGDRCTFIEDRYINEKTAKALKEAGYSLTYNQAEGEYLVSWQYPTTR